MPIQSTVEQLVLGTLLIEVRKKDKASSADPSKTAQRYNDVPGILKEKTTMITALVQFKLPQPITREKAREIFLSTAPRYRETPGLLRKYYVLSQDGGTAGGIYLWESRKDAEKLYTKDWEDYVRDKYGAPPSLTYFESPVVVDNVTNEIISDQ